jgi:hypothetical protein
MLGRHGTGTINSILILTLLNDSAAEEDASCRIISLLGSFTINAGMRGDMLTQNLTLRV